MFGGDRDSETICAVSTPPGRGGVAVIRISGDKALRISKIIAPFLPDSTESHKIYFGTIIDPTTTEAIDEVLISYFKQGRSYTGDETVEISCHGNPAITDQVLRILCEQGASLAGPGEFTYRAFLNGNIDLIQAENVLSLIEGKTEKQRRVALRNLKGELSNKVSQIEDSLIYVMAQLEASIDFIEEDIQTYEVSDLQMRLSKASDQLTQLRESFKGGRVLADGIEVAILGPTNAGKSSLLNQLIQEDRAIVTEIPGTTRDIVTAEFNIDGFLIQFSDTAGIRETEDIVEKIGIDRSKKVANSADFVFYVCDGRRAVEPEEKEFIKEISKKCPVIFLANKTDLFDGQVNEMPALQSIQDLKGVLYGIDAGSVVSGSLVVKALDSLRSYLRSEFDVDTALVTRPRQYEMICAAMDSLTEGISLLSDNMSPDLVASKIKMALLAVQEVEGKQFDDDILDRIFKDFCIGK